MRIGADVGLFEEFPQVGAFGKKIEIPIDIDTIWERNTISEPIYGLIQFSCR
jgi:hypothetical protein